jgi:putative transposase
LLAITCRSAGSLDFVSDTFGASRKFRMLAVNDDCCRENLCPLSADCFSIACRATDGRHQHLWCEGGTRAGCARVYGKPACIVSDNGTEFTRRAILKWAGDNGVDWHCIDPGKPQQSGFIESFNGSLRRSRARKHALPGNGRAAERGNLRYVRRCPPQTGPLAI